MTSYYLIRLGAGGAHGAECFAGGFIGADYGIKQDLAGDLPDKWDKFNAKFIPVYLALYPAKSKIAAGLACGTLWTVAKGIQKGDVVLSPDGAGIYRVGDVVGDYAYAADGVLPHRRNVSWRPGSIAKASMSDALRHAVGSIGALANITPYAEELQMLLTAPVAPPIVATDETIEDPATFALERHLEDFLVANWPKTDFGKHYDIFEDAGEQVGRQYQTDTGPIDILAVSKSGEELLVVELKRGRASDVVVGQILRYMGYVAGELAADGQTVRGVIVALEDDQKLKRALSVTPSVEFYRYTVTFKLEKA